MSKTKVTVTHFIPLIGPFKMAVDTLKKEYDIEDTYVVSYPPFGKNEEQLHTNYPNLNQFLLDETQCDGQSSDLSYYKNYIMENKIKPTALTASVCPCAGLSMLNTGNRGSDAKANDWIIETTKFFLAQGSDCLVIENAPALAGSKGLPILERINKILEDNGVKDQYKMQMTRTTTSQHGLPQNRSRSFLYVYKNDSDKFKVLKNIKNEYTPIEKFFTRPEKYEEGTDHIPIKKGHFWHQFATEKNLLKPFKEYADATKGTVVHFKPWVLELWRKDKSIVDGHPKVQKLVEHMDYKLSIGKGVWDGSPAYGKEIFNAVISKNVVKYMHPVYTDRHLSIREYMDLMGYPDTFKLINPSRDWKYICQSIPITTAADHLRWGIALAGKDESYLSDAEVEVQESEILIQDNKKGDLENTFFEVDKEYKTIKKLKRQ